MSFLRRVIGNPWAQCLLLALAILAAYSNSTPASFHFDDTFFVHDPAVLHGVWSADAAGSRYLTLQSFVLNYALSGADPASFLWSDVVQKAPHKSRGHNDLGIAYLVAGRADLAVEQFKLAVSEEPDEPDDRLNLAQAYAASGDAASAVGTLQQVIGEHPDHAGAHEQLGYLYASAGKLPEALQEFHTAVRLAPRSLPFRDNLALTERSAGQPEAALQDFSQALALDPQDPNALFQYGELSLQARRLDDACRAFLADLPLQPDDPRMMYYGARCKLRVGDRAGAIRMLQVLESRHPGVTPAATLLQQLH